MAEARPQITTPEEATKERSKVVEEQRNLSGPDLAEQRRLERQAMLRNVAQQTLQNLESPQNLLVAQQGIQQQAQQIPIQQQQAQGEAALQTLQQEGDIALSKQQQRAKQYESAANVGISRLALETARRAFDLGYSSKQLALHQNAQVSDLAFEQMYYDLQEGRITQKEILNLGRKLKADAQRMKQEADIALREALKQMETYKTGYNAERAKKRLLAAIAAQKAAMERAAQASNTGAILSGVFTIGGAIAGGIIGGGPAGATVGASIGGAVAPIVSQNM